jgi:hypothetical protein
MGSYLCVGEMRCKEVGFYRRESGNAWGWGPLLPNCVPPGSRGG